MSTDIVMPKLSDTMEEGKILRWLKQAGETVAAGEVIAEVETDKADMELEASESGVLSAIRVPEGESAAVGAVIAVLDGAAASVSPRPAEPKPAPVSPDRKASAAAPVSDGASTGAPDETDVASEPAPPAKVAASPRAAGPPKTGGAKAGEATPKASAAARALASERGVDLATVRGSGPGGRIVSEDVETAVESPRPKASGSPAPRAADAPASGREAPVVERHELSRMRQSIARRMSEAFRDIPHFAVTAEIDMSEAVRLKAALEHEAIADVPITYTHMVLKATARALTRHPRLNASYRDGALEVHADVNLGMAVAVEDGLIVPVLRRAHERSLAEIASEARRLVALTKQGKFASDDLSGGTFTVSNMGMLDIESFTAVINPPQSAILAVGSIKPRPVVRDGAIVAAHTMRVTVSCDHRIIDGVMAGRFLEELKALLERPLGLVIA